MKHQSLRLVAGSGEMNLHCLGQMDRNLFTFIQSRFFLSGDLLLVISNHVLKHPFRRERPLSLGIFPSSGGVSVIIPDSHTRVETPGTEGWRFTDSAQLCSNTSLKVSVLVGPSWIILVRFFHQRVVSRLIQQHQASDTQRHLEKGFVSCKDLCLHMSGSELHGVSNQAFFCS